MKKIVIDSMGIELLVSDELCVLLNTKTGGFETSSDGTHWTKRESPIGEWVNVSHNNGEFSVTTEMGAKMVSKDAVCWTLLNK